MKQCYRINVVPSATGASKKLTWNKAVLLEKLQRAQLKATNYEISSAQHLKVSLSSHPAMKVSHLWHPEAARAVSPDE